MNCINNGLPRQQTIVYLWLKFFKDSYRNDIYSSITSNEQFLNTQIILGGIFFTPIIRDGYILFAGTEGVLYCLEKIKLRERKYIN
jgi:hypothetical protein